MDGLKFLSKRRSSTMLKYSHLLICLLQTIFADDTYSKPYFVTYVNSSFFSVLLILVVAKRLWASGGSIRGAIRGHNHATLYSAISEDEHEAFVKPNDEEGVQGVSRSPRSQLLVEEPMSRSGTTAGITEARLNVRETAWLSFEFCILWVLHHNSCYFQKKLISAVPGPCVHMQYIGGRHLTNGPGKLLRSSMSGIHYSSKLNNINLNQQ